MATVLDVAAYILKQRGTMSAMKLQKLCYYSHAWHLVWEEAPLFSEKIEAWANGPVIRDLYYAHKGQFSVSTIESGKVEALTHDETTTIDAVLNFYGDMTAHELSELTHSERPWLEARRAVPVGARSDVVISDDVIAPYYDSLTQAAASR
ncbi:MAG: DUF4065 domain-containing protein [Actinobacteria bacterium]|nr:DUF4065 domain-containing protein [Actinomycetota bacterium]